MGQTTQHWQHFNTLLKTNSCSTFSTLLFGDAVVRFANTAGVKSRRTFETATTCRKEILDQDPVCWSGEVPLELQVLTSHERFSCSAFLAGRMLAAFLSAIHQGKPHAQSCFVG